MPCPDCGNLLCLRENTRSLFCPQCNGHRVESQAVINAITEWLLKDHLTENKIDYLLTRYSKQNLTYTLFRRLNHSANLFLNRPESPIRVDEFGHLAYVIKRVYEIDNSEFGTETISQDTPDLNDTLKTVQKYYAEYVDRLERAQNRFSVCVRDPDEFSGRMKDFHTDYNRYQSEYGLCYDRCINSVGGDIDHYEDFSYIYDEIRATGEGPRGDEDTPREFAKAWYQFIQQFRFVAGSDNRIGPTYKTSFPEEITVFDFDAFLEELDRTLTPEAHAHIQHNSAVPPLQPRTVDRCGREVFGNQWSEMKDSLIVSEDNLDAHPFLFEMTFDIPHQTPQGSSITVPTTNVYYPRQYAHLLKFQVFPMLQNGEGTADGHTLLSNVAGEHGTDRERNLFDFITDQGVQCYHSAEIEHKNQKEIDLLCLFEDRRLFIEVKYLFPPLRINERDGINELNEKFNRLIFNEVPSDSDREGKGPFPEKVQAWKELEPGDTFKSQISPDGERDQHEVPERWDELDVDMFVISNVVPSFITKRGVQFLTDLEFYQYLKYDDERGSLYSIESS